MKLVCLLSDLDQALDIVGRAISQNSTLPVLNNVLLKAEGNRLFFSGTNLEVGIECFIGAEIFAEGSITVPAKLLTSYVGFLRDEKVELNVDDLGNLQIKSLSAQTKIKGIAAEEFPVIPHVEKEVVFEVTSKLLEGAINQTVFAAATNTTRPILSGVLFDLKGGKLKLVATDSYRLAEKVVSLSGEVDKEVQAICPARTVGELAKIVSKLKVEKVEVIVSKNQIQFNAGDVKMVSRLIEGKFPDYEKIIPSSSRTKFEVDIAELNLVLRRVSLFARENNNNVKFLISSDDKMLVSTDETKLGEEQAEIKGKTYGDENKIALNADFMLDVLNYLSVDKIVIEVEDKLAPLVVREVKDGEKDYLYLIMPLKI